MSISANTSVNVHKQLSPL